MYISEHSTTKSVEQLSLFGSEYAELLLGEKNETLPDNTLGSEDTSDCTINNALAWQKFEEKENASRSTPKKLITPPSLTLLDQSRINSAEKIKAIKRVRRVGKSVFRGEYDVSNLIQAEHVLLDSKEECVWRCLKCNHQYSESPYNRSELGYGCKNCAMNELTKFCTDPVLARLLQTTEYTSGENILLSLTTQKLKWRCNNHRSPFTYYRTLQRQSQLRTCPKCAREKSYKRY